MSNESSKQPYNIKLGLKQYCDFPSPPGVPKSRVVGIDTYVMQADSGNEYDWKSYTLEARAEEGTYDSQWDRWWAVNVPNLGAHFYVAALQRPEGIKLEFDPDLSGKVRLLSKGDSKMSGNVPYTEGNLKTYRMPDGRLYAEEELEDAPTKLLFIGTLYDHGLDVD